MHLHYDPYRKITTARLSNFILFYLFVFRVVGGLLSAYDLSGDKVFLDKAKDITDRLLPAWDTTSGIPYNRINLAHGRAHNPGWTNVSY
jgi:hypothetical protein